MSSIEYRDPNLTLQCLKMTDNSFTTMKAEGFTEED